MSIVARVLVLMCCVGAIACSPPPRPVVVTAPRPAGDPRFPIVSMHLIATEGARGSTARTNIELRPDGGLYIGDRMVGRISGTRLLDDQGRELFAATDSPASLRLQGRNRRVQVSDTGALLLDEDERIYFDDSGRVVDDRPHQPPAWLYMQMEGLQPNALGTGAMMVLFNMIRPPSRH